MDKKKILVVDDEENIRILYSEELRDEGYDVIVASNAEEADIKIKESSPDLITLDIKMPGMDGIDFLRKVREHDKNIPIVMCSAYSDYKQDFRTWASEAYVVKSSDMVELKSIIREILKKGRSR
ncbi:MAG TPA: two-component system response regulator [Nitrospinae bacterium]|nr:two-component system response regulator [Nitrospinota bacterium]HBA27111.1 two-component system response regulator [Nitrospinota bacterium]